MVFPSVFLLFGSNITCWRTNLKCKGEKSAAAKPYCLHRTCSAGACACSGCHRRQLTVVVLLSQLLAQILHLHMWRFHPLQLAPVVFFLPPTSGVIWWWWWWYTYVNVMVVVVAMGWYHPLQCGVFPSACWPIYHTCTQATCTVWWCFFGGGGRCVC